MAASAPDETGGWQPNPAPPRMEEARDYVTRRFEPAGFPIFGGNSDIGFEIGAAGTLSYFSEGVRPYAWNMDASAALSFKGGPNGGIEIAQQLLQWNIDKPGLLDGRLRVNPQAIYSRTINQPYFGLGNDASGAPAPPTNPNPGRYHEFIQRIVEANSSARYQLVGPLQYMALASFRFVTPETYDASKLTQDETASSRGLAPTLYATSSLSLGGLATGLVYDSRDDETFPRTGMYHQLGVRFEEGFPFDDDTRYGEAGVILTNFLPIGGPVVLATRGLFDMQFGHVPFYDLYVNGPFQLHEAIGGSTGIRGVPTGRYLGPIKLVVNVELRALWTRFTLFKQRIAFGDNLFFDTGRIWSDYTFHSPLDGSGLGLKYGVGGGMYWMWGQAAIFRVELAYSPDAASENPKFPFGFYVEDGTMF